MHRHIQTYIRSHVGADSCKSRIRPGGQRDNIRSKFKSVTSKNVLLFKKSYIYHLIFIKLFFCGNVLAIIKLTFHGVRLVVGVLLALSHCRRDRGQAGDLHAPVTAHMLLGELDVQLADAEHALLLLGGGHGSRRSRHSAATARMRERALVARRQLVHRTRIGRNAQLLVHVGRLRTEAAAVQGAADDAQSVLIYMASVLAVAVPGNRNKEEFIE